MIPFFDPRDLRCKSPFGALPAGQCAVLSLFPPRSLGVTRAVCLAVFEQTGETREIPLRWTGCSGGQDVFSGVLQTRPEDIGLVWYQFRLETQTPGETPLFYGAAGTLNPAPSDSYQLTVYSPAAEDAWAGASWFGAGMTYQIFPDRFRRTPIQSPLPPGRVLHESWDDTPEYRPDDRGIIRNNDFFGGTLLGILERLPYFKSLGVDTLYLCPIFKAAENHRYGVGDYETIDPMLGDEADFKALCSALHEAGMRLILDGVFSHTGSVSRYFDGDGSVIPGAAQAKESPYFPWYRFSHYPDAYDCWWGIPTLPEVNELEPSYLSYIVTDENSIVRRWLRAGADGWRLDVADELPDGFIRALYAAAKETKPEAAVIGEVWEDGSNKVSYGQRRRYLLGGHLDGLMNYPFRTALLTYLLQSGAEQFMEEMETLRAHYPPAVFFSSMNFLGTHDTPRILTLLGLGPDGAAKARTKEEKAAHRLDDDARSLAVSRLKLAALILFTFPGSPTVYYGDEAGMEGFEDPFNRRTFPWGGENTSLVAHFSKLSALRRAHPALQRGEIAYLIAKGPILAFSRSLPEERLYTVSNSGNAAMSVTLPWDGPPPNDLLTGQTYQPANGALSLTLPPLGAMLLWQAPEQEGPQ